MSSKAEMSDGLKSGIMQGYKSGLSFAKMDCGIRKGLLAGVTRHDKVQDPSLLLGIKRPLNLWLSDFATRSGTTITALPNLITGTSLTIGSSPAYIDKGFLNNRGYIEFNSGSDILTAPAFPANKNELTVMLLVRIRTAAANSNQTLYGSGQVLFSKIQSTAATIIGDLSIHSIEGNRIRVTLVGNPTSTNCVYETFDSSVAGVVEGKGWNIITVKCRLYQPQGPGSQIEIYVNGVLNMTRISDDFVESTSTFGNNAITYGNNSGLIGLGGTPMGSHIAGGLVLDYWANSSEQIRLENFFRWYYGYRF